MAGSDWLRLDHIPEHVLAVFWRQLALLIEVGVPLLKALHQVAERTSHRPLCRVIQRVAADIEAGNSLSEALARHPQAFQRSQYRCCKWLNEAEYWTTR